MGWLGFHRPNQTHGIVWHGGMSLPVTPAQSISKCGCTWQWVLNDTTCRLLFVKPWHSYFIDTEQLIGRQWLEIFAVLCMRKNVCIFCNNIRRFLDFRRCSEQYKIVLLFPTFNQGCQNNHLLAVCVATHRRIIVAKLLNYIKELYTVQSRLHLFQCFVSRFDSMFCFDGSLLGSWSLFWYTKPTRTQNTEKKLETNPLFGQTLRTKLHFQSAHKPPNDNIADWSQQNYYNYVIVCFKLWDCGWQFLLFWRQLRSILIPLPE